jgi:hypothetical protein
MEDMLHNKMIQAGKWGRRWRRREVGRGKEGKERKNKPPTAMKKPRQVH